MNESEDDETINLSQMDQRIDRITRASIKSEFTIYPDSNFRSIVDCISFVIILLISLYIPLLFAFDIETNNEGLVYMEMFIDSWFMFEIGINFFTGFYKRGKIVM